MGRIQRYRNIEVAMTMIIEKHRVFSSTCTSAFMRKL